MPALHAHLAWRQEKPRTGLLVVILALILMSKGELTDRTLLRAWEAPRWPRT